MIPKTRKPWNHVDKDPRQRGGGVRGVGSWLLWAVCQSENPVWINLSEKRVFKCAWTQRADRQGLWEELQADDARRADKNCLLHLTLRVTEASYQKYTHEIHMELHLCACRREMFCCSKKRHTLSPLNQHQTCLFLLHCSFVLFLCIWAKSSLFPPAFVSRFKPLRAASCLWGRSSVIIRLWAAQDLCHCPCCSLLSFQKQCFSLTRSSFKVKK